MKLGAFPLLLTTLFLSGSALALDTLEPYAPGLSDAELYVGAESVGGPRSEATPFVAGGVGAGLTERLSLFVGYGAASNGYLSQSSHGIDIALYGNVGNWGTLSLDLGGAFTEGDDSMQAGPTFELNWDFAPDQSLAGVYLHGGPTAAGAGAAVDWTWEQGLGGYYTLREGKQLFLEWTTGYDLGRSPAHRAIDYGSLAVGFNWVVADTLELITEAGATVPQDGAESRLQGSVGFIATLP